jgi:hypothetical protein
LQERINSSTSTTASEQERLENPPGKHFEDLVLNVEYAQMSGGLGATQEIWDSGWNAPKNVFR